MFVSGSGEAESFQLEMSGLLSELSCPYYVLSSGDVTQRFLNRTDCLLLLCTTSLVGLICALPHHAPHQDMSAFKGQLSVFGYMFSGCVGSFKGASCSITCFLLSADTICRRAKSVLVKVLLIIVITLQLKYYTRVSSH